MNRRQKKKLLLKEIFIFFCILTIVNLSDSFVIECNYRYSGFIVVSFEYECYVKNNLEITDKDSRMINSVSGHYASGMTNKDVMSLDVRKKGTINYFPKGLQNIFGDLKAIVIENCHLKEIQQSDLKPFGELVLLGLSQNDIEIIEDGLFSFNPKLEDINFSYNRIIHIGMQVFENLNHLIYLILNSNNCIDEQAYDDAKEMARVIKLTKTACKDPTIACLKIIDNSKCNCTQGSIQEFQTTDHKSNLTQSIEKLLNESKIEISSLKEHIKLTEQRSNVHDKLKMIIGVCIALNFIIFGILFIILYQVSFTS